MEKTSCLDSPGNLAYYLYIQQAYKPHTDIPTREELLDRNPQYLAKQKAEKKETAKGPARYFLRGYRPKKRPVAATKGKAKRRAKAKAGEAPLVPVKKVAHTSPVRPRKVVF